MFTNTIFSVEKEAQDFAKKSMKRNYEYKVVEYNKENYDLEWNCSVSFSHNNDSYIFSKNSYKIVFWGMFGHKCLSNRILGVFFTEKLMNV